MASRGFGSVHFCSRPVSRELYAVITPWCRHPQTWQHPSCSRACTSVCTSTCMRVYRVPFPPWLEKKPKTAMPGGPKPYVENISRCARARLPMHAAYTSQAQAKASGWMDNSGSSLKGKIRGCIRMPGTLANSSRHCMPKLSSMRLRSIAFPKASSCATKHLA